MFNRRRVFYNTLLPLAVLGAFGCGQAAPPPGAPKSVSPASVDLGPEAGPKDPPAAITDSIPGGGSPQDQQGDTK
jgi:hypothetical protein